MTAAGHMRQVMAGSGAYILTGQTPVDWELEAYGAGFQLVADAIEGLEEELFLQTAPADRLAQWEKLWHGEPAGASLEDRQKMAVQWMRSRPAPLRKEQLPGLMLAAGVRANAVESADGLAITVEEYLLPEAQVRKNLQKLLPIHMSWSLLEE